MILPEIWATFALVSQCYSQTCYSFSAYLLSLRLIEPKITRRLRALDVQCKCRLPQISSHECSYKKLLASQSIESIMKHGETSNSQIAGKLLSGEVDALPGRGALLPMLAVNASGNINSRIFLRYLSDLKYSVRIHELGWRIMVSQKVDIFSSAENADQEMRQQGFRKEYFPLRSKNNLPQRLWFFSLIGPIWLRLWADSRYFFVGGRRLLKRIAR